ncbi:MAG: Holliday junction branch migration protein RuvA [Planctomycetota bacterium]
MISRLEGKLNRVGDDSATLSPTAGVDVDVLLPPTAVQSLGGRVGERVALHTHLFLESQGQGVVMLPRLAGFLAPSDRAFYLLLTGVKGIGLRRGLRVLAAPTADIAAAVAQGDVKFIQTLPEIGKKTAESLILALRDKVAPFVEVDVAVSGQGGGVGSVAMPGVGSGAAFVGSGAFPGAGAAGLAVAALEQLGEDASMAAQKVARVLQAEPSLAEADEPEPIIAAALRFEG